MESAATVEQNGQKVDVGFSVLDITKHALNTIVEALQPADRLCIVTFSTSARVAMPMKHMTRANKEGAKETVNRMHAEGSTNLWDALRVALKELEGSRRESSCMTSMFVLTDGVPTEHLLPPRGIVNTLKKQLQRMEQGSGNDGQVMAPPTIYTFGFGYELDTPLLVEIARVGKGCFSFIPDSGFVGTVLVVCSYYL
jgi:hypothetical protein